MSFLFFHPPSWRDMGGYVGSSSHIGRCFRARTVKLIQLLVEHLLLHFASCALDFVVLSANCSSLSMVEWWNAAMVFFLIACHVVRDQVHVFLIMLSTLINEFY